MATNPPQDIGTLLQRMSLQDQALYRLTPEQSRENAQAAGPALLNRIREGIVGMIKGNSTDIINTIQQVSDLITPGTEPANKGKPLGDEIFQAITGEKPSGSGAETAGSMISVGGPAKKILGGLIGAGVTAKVANVVKNAVTGTEDVSDVLRISDRGMIVAANKTGRTGAVDEAKKLIEEGVSNQALFNQTGTYLDQDKILKGFISDKEATLNTRIMAELSSGAKTNVPLGDILDHPNLYKAYPDLRQVQVFRNDRPGLGGSYNKEGDYMTANMTEPEFTRSALLHETQHAVQKREGFTPGSNVRAHIPFNVEQFQEKLNTARQSEDPSILRAVNRFKEAGNKAIKQAEVKYMNTAGEQEARFTQFTENMSDLEGNKQIMEYLRVGQTPQTWDTRVLPSSSSGK